MKRNNEEKEKIIEQQMKKINDYNIKFNDLKEKERLIENIKQ